MIVNKKDSISFIKFSAIINEIAFVSQVCIVAVYWPVIHKEVIKDFDIHKETRGEEFAIAFHQLMIYVHSLPAVVIFSNVIISRIVLCFEHVGYIFIYGMIYLCVNYFATL